MGSLAKRIGRLSTPEQLASMVIEMTTTIDDLRCEKSAQIERWNLAMVKITNTSEKLETTLGTSIGELKQVMRGIYEALGEQSSPDAHGDPYPLEVLASVIDLVERKSSGEDVKRIRSALKSIYETLEMKPRLIKGQVDHHPLINAIFKLSSSEDIRLASLLEAEEHVTRCHKERDETSKTLASVRANLESVRAKARGQVDQIDSLRREILGREKNAKAAWLDMRTIREEVEEAIKERDEAREQAANALDRAEDATVELDTTRIELEQAIDERDKASTALILANEELSSLLRVSR